MSADKLSAPALDAGNAVEAQVVRPTERVYLTFKDGKLEVKPYLFVLLVPKDGLESSLKWDIDIPAGYTLEINFVADYIQPPGLGWISRSTGEDVRRGPFARPRNGVHGRYMTRGAAKGEKALESGRVEVSEESYWKYEVTVTGPDGTPEAVVDPGGILKDWP